MNKPDTAALWNVMHNMELQVRNYLKEFLKDTDEEHPYLCDIPIGDWCACGLSSLELPHVQAMYYDKEYDEVYLTETDIEDDYWYPLSERPFQEMIEVIEGLD